MKTTINSIFKQHPLVKVFVVVQGLVLIVFAWVAYDHYF